MKCKTCHGKNEEKGEFENPWSESQGSNVVSQSCLDPFRNYIETQIMLNR